jgi:hypothetical protein
MKIDADLAFSLCSLRQLLAGRRGPVTETFDTTLVSRFVVGEYITDIHAANDGDRVVQYHGGRELGQRDLRSPADFASFMYMFDTRLAAGVTGLTASALALCDTLATTFDRHTLERTLPLTRDLPPATAEIRAGLERLAELDPRCAGAVEAFLAGGPPAAPDNLGDWHDRVESWVTSGMKTEVVRGDGYVVRRVYSEAGLASAAYRAGTGLGSVVDTGAGFARRLASFMRARSPDSLLSNAAAYYEIRRDGETGSALLRIPSRGDDVRTWVSPESTLDPAELLSMARPAEREPELAAATP